MPPKLKKQVISHTDNGSNLTTPPKESQNDLTIPIKTRSKRILSPQDQPQKKTKISMFTLSQKALDLSSRGLQDGIILAEKIIKTQKFVEYLFEVSKHDIQNDLVRNYIQENVFEITPFFYRGNFTSYAYVLRQDHPFTIFLNPILLIQLQFSEKYSTTQDALNIQIQKNSFFIAAKICHEFSHLAHLACGIRLKNIPPEQPQITPPKTINKVKYTDFGDMMEKELFGCIVRLYHIDEWFGIQQLVAVEKPNDCSGKKINLEENNFIIDEQLENIKVNFRGPDVTDLEIRDGRQRMSASRGSIPDQELCDHEEVDYVDLMDVSQRRGFRT